MMRVVYIDTMLFTNSVINYLLLLGAGSFSGLPYSRRRLLLSSVFGSLYGVLYYFIDRGGVLFLLCTVAVGLVMVLIAFGFTSSRLYLKRVVTFFLVVLFFGGGVLVLYLAGGGVLSDYRVGSLFAAIDLRILFISTLLCYGIISLFFKGVAEHGGYGGETVDVILQSENRSVKFRALVDTGNSLRDAISKSRVLVVESEAVRLLLPYGIRHLFEPDSLGDAASLLENLSTLGYGEKFRLIPYRSVGVEHGLLVAFRPEHALVDNCEMKDLLVALSPADLSEGAGYCALIGRIK